MEPEARTARRALWVFRLIFYPTAALIAAVALGANFGGSPPDAPETWQGRTSQGRVVTLHFAGGRPDVLTTSVRVSCAQGSYVHYIRVYAGSDGAFERNRRWTQPYDDGYEGTGNTVLHARVRDDAVKGRAWETQRVARQGQSYACGSGWVMFAAQR